MDDRRRATLPRDMHEGQAMSGSPAARAERVHRLVESLSPDPGKALPPVPERASAVRTRLVRSRYARNARWQSGTHARPCFAHRRLERHAAASAFSSAISLISRMIVASWRSTIWARAFVSVVPAGRAPDAPPLPANR